MDAETTLESLVVDRLGREAGRAALGILAVDPSLLVQAPTVSRAVLAMALNILLFHDLIGRVPSGKTYVDGRIGAGETIVFDHGALRTIRFATGPTGDLPAGQDAFSRLFEPLGYRLAGVYPLPRLHMTGRAYCHIDAPEVIPQFFLSELHVDQFDAGFEAAARRAFGASRDPIDAGTAEILSELSSGGELSLVDAATALAAMAKAFARQHDVVTLADYETLLASSAEAAWIATEGNSFNHATHRVANVEALAVTLREQGYPIKDHVEISTSGRVRQTALRADAVEREFIGPDGTVVERSVPGSFYELISRDIDPETGRLDLAFDSNNATGIFAMTRERNAIPQG